MHGCPAGFGLPNRRKRVFVLASLHGDARDVLLSQVGLIAQLIFVLDLMSTEGSSLLQQMAI